jgi:hypothetical protein
MKQRCENPNNPKYYRYGARGIKVCERWRRSFEVFSKDMGPRPEGHSIERRDNDGNYEPSNCVWATRKAQQRNRCTNKFVEYLGNKMTLFEAVEISKTIIPYETIYFRLRQGWELSQALTRPLNPNGRPRKAIRKRDRVS